MSEEKHSKLPWTASDQYLYDADDHTLPIASGKLEWATDRGGPVHNEAVANAALIVRSVNAVPALMKALEEIADCPLVGYSLSGKESHQQLAELISHLDTIRSKHVGAARAALATYRKES